MELIVPISNDPLIGLERQVRLIDFNWNLRNNFIQLQLEVEFSTADKLRIETKRLNSYSVTLVADDSILVDAKTGAIVEYENKQDIDMDGNLFDVKPIEYIDPFTRNELVLKGKYTYFTEAANSGPIDIVGLIKNAILAGDLLKKFDV